MFARMTLSGQDSLPCIYYHYLLCTIRGLVEYHCFLLEVDQFSGKLKGKVIELKHVTEFSM